PRMRPPSRCRRPAATAPRSSSTIGRRKTGRSGPAHSCRAPAACSCLRTTIPPSWRGRGRPPPGAPGGVPARAGPGRRRAGVGGGGLMAGCSTAALALRPAIKIFGVEADTANDTYLSVRKGERVTIAPPPTIADGIRNLSPGVLTFPINRRTVSEVLLVSDEEIAEAVRFLLLRGKVLVEPTGAVPAADLLAGRLPLPTWSKVGVVLSGGNIDPELLARILAGHD